MPLTLWRGVMTHRVKINDLQGKGIKNSEEGGCLVIVMGNPGVSQGYPYPYSKNGRN